MDAKAQLVEKLHSANNILVTVSNNPSVDQLAACIGMTLWLNKLGKHSTAVFSGEIPNTLEFLQPESTIEKNTNSLRDFIIALDKSKADKLRYKVEDRVVKIFITPYRTSLSADDLEFSQGDFNVDAIVALGVTKQSELDQAITAHGRILHDAVVASINTSEEEGLGSINYHDASASSLSEMAYDVCQQLDPKQIDPQIATALLTGVVAATNRFSNLKTTPNAMSVSAALMAAGANQQLVANKLEGTLGSSNDLDLKAASNQATPNEAGAKTESEDGKLEIRHDEGKPLQDTPPVELVNEAELPQVQDNPEPKTDPDSRLITSPPSMSGTLTANSMPEDTRIEPTSDALSTQPTETAELLSHGPLTPISNDQPGSQPVNDQQPAPAPVPTNDVGTPAAEDQDDQTLSEIEQSVSSPHLSELKAQVNEALNAAEAGEAPRQADQSPAETSSSQFNPANFGLDQEENEDAPPEVPPPIVPPNFLPPNPPPSTGS